MKIEDSEKYRIIKIPKDRFEYILKKYLSDEKRNYKLAVHELLIEFLAYLE